VKYYVQVPAEQHLFFPPFCPYNRAASAVTNLRLEKTSTGIILPIPFFGIYQSYTKTSMDIPVSAKLRVTAACLRIFSCLCLLGAITVPMLSLLNKIAWLKGTEGSVLLGGIVLACVLSIARWWILRKVRIVGSWNSFIEVRFHSADYAQQFSEMNKLLCEGR
jgi:hypothetical protein